MPCITNRRRFLKQATVCFAVATAGPAAAMPTALLPAAEPAAGQMPKIRLGTLEVSRLILGSNPFFGFSHGNPQATPKEMTEYYTPKQIKAVLDEAAGQGITAVWVPCYDHWIRIWREYQDEGGKLKIWIAQPDRSPMEKEIAKAAAHGAKAICVQGEHVDSQFAAGKFDVLRKWLEQIKSFDLPAGLATHRPQTHLVVEDKKLPTDFYHQCVYQPENYSQQCLEQALATIAKLEKPVVAYKVLGAGRIMPKEALPRLFERIRPKDGLCVGVFPKKNRQEIAENAALVKRLSANA